MTPSPHSSDSNGRNQTDIDTAADQSDVAGYRDLPESQSIILLLSIMIVALCGIVYELIIGTVSSYLLGNSVVQFSLTIGFFMFAMGVGSFLSKYIGRHLIQIFIYVEIALAIIGGMCSIGLFMVFPYAPWLYQCAMLMFIFVIGALVGLEIPLLTRVLSARRGTRRSIADVMSLDYVGALVGSVAFPLFLLPTLGLITASFAIGLINALVALVNVIWLRDHLKAPRVMLFAVISLIVLLIVLTLSATRITAFAQQHLYFDQIIWQKNTPYQQLIVTRDWPKQDLRLFIDGHLQFSELDEYRYHESLVHPVMSWSSAASASALASESAAESITEAPEKILVLGGGDGLAVREILKYPSVKQIDLVDIDPEMTRLGLSFAPLLKLNEDSLSDPRVNIINADAFVFIRETQTQYDRVIIDFPDPHNEAISKLYSVEFYALVQARMAEDAVLVTQSSSPFFTRRTYWAIAETLEAVFGEVESYSIGIPAFGIWGFHLISQSGDIASGGVAQFPADLRYLNQAVFEAARVFPEDIARLPDMHANSIFEPSLYEVYLRDLQKGPKS